MFYKARAKYVHSNNYTIRCFNTNNGKVTVPYNKQWNNKINQCKYDKPQLWAVLKLVINTNNTSTVFRNNSCVILIDIS